MNISKEEIISAVDNMTVLELSNLVKTMETHFGVSAAAVATVASATQPVEEEQTEFTVILTDFGANKVAAIKIVREITGLDLSKSKALVEAAPDATIKEGMNKVDAESLLKKFSDAGAKAKIK